MCVIFLYTNPDAEAGQFRLILATNRDESYKRPAKQAHFWDESPTIIGGRDMEPGREGGTWFAMSRKGRLAALLNVMGGTSAHAKGRGSLVPEYLAAGCDAGAHLSGLHSRAHEYSRFNLLAVDVRRDGIDVHQLSNTGDVGRTHASGQGFHGVGNHWLGRPTRKVSAGLSRFAGVVEGPGRATAAKEELVDGLLALLKWDEKHYPDPVLESLASNSSPEKRQALSSVFISFPGAAYGTRTHTVVLIDYNDKVDFFEWTMAQPIQPDNPQWEKQHYTFQLDYDN
ncbi:transport and Golgi organization protein 2 homolog isoform X2 [Bacillus rossius redtenbacheri]|uniref:transport and Golgi organization protein 2 homolog isoform X2 n=1 Tax=Bacillus rossius redtenbacheri TaxID=93214 RepID=UPI002FDCC20A